jgi:gamma-polyglutamate synthase
VILSACLLVLLALGVMERLSLARARRAVAIRIHVNGTRGKSTVTRLVAAALREAGVPTLAKVTGTAPRLILPDGTERPVRRWAPANIREQAWVLRQARKTGARALVAECMAVRPDLQWTSERDILQSTHGVITNVRLDHTDVMGATIDKIARSLANTVPRHGVLIAGDKRAVPILAARCAQAGCRLVVANAPARDLATTDRTERGIDGSLGDENSADPVSVALAVTRELGIDDATAVRGMGAAAPDSGAASRGTTVVGGRAVTWLDVTAANDPESTDLLAAIQPPLQPREAVLCVYNHREDRPERLATFAPSSVVFTSAAVVLLTGDRPSLPLSRRVRRSCAGDVRFVPRSELAGAIARVAAAHPRITRVVYCGNTRGFVRPRLERD